MGPLSMKVGKFRNQLKFCNQILERHNFVHLIKLCNTTKGKHFKQKLKNFSLLPQYVVYNSKTSRESFQNSTPAGNNHKAATYLTPT